MENKALEDSSSSWSQTRILRNIQVCAALLFVVCVSHMVGITRGKESCITEMLPPLTMVTRDRLLEISAESNRLVYLTSSDILFVTIAKGGSTSAWNWLFLGTKGRQFSREECQTYVQNSESSCWGEEAVKLSRLSPEERISILTSTKTLRVAVQRDPLSRILSSYRSKFACENFHNPKDPFSRSDARDRSRMVPMLRRRAGFPEGRPCMNISEFASALESVRQKAATPGYASSSLREIDPHIRPQEFYFDEIDYDIVLHTTDMGNKEYLKPIIDRLRYKDLIKDGIKHAHATTQNQMLIPENATQLLYKFALESKMGEPNLFTNKK